MRSWFDCTQPVTNYRDTLVARQQSRFTAGRVPLSDGAGEVIQVGEEVGDWQVGDRVAGTFFRDWQSGRFHMKYHDALWEAVDGVLRQQAIFPAHALVRIPKDYSFLEASTLPCAGLTAGLVLVDGPRPIPTRRIGARAGDRWSLDLGTADRRCIGRSSHRHFVQRRQSFIALRNSGHGERSTIERSSTIGKGSASHHQQASVSIT